MDEAEQYFHQHQPLLEHVVKEYVRGAPHIQYVEVHDDSTYDLFLSRNGVNVDIYLYGVSLHHDTVKQIMTELGVDRREVDFCHALLDSAGLLSVGSSHLYSNYTVSVGYLRYSFMMSKTTFVKTLRAEKPKMVRSRKLDSTWVLQWGTPAFDSNYDSYDDE